MDITGLFSCVIPNWQRAISESSKSRVYVGYVTWSINRYGRISCSFCLTIRRPDLKGTHLYRCSGYIVFARVLGSRNVIGRNRIRALHRYSNIPIPDCQTKQRPPRNELRHRQALLSFMARISDLTDNETLLTTTKNFVMVEEGANLKLPCKITVKDAAIKLTKSGRTVRNSSRVWYSNSETFCAIFECLLKHSEPLFRPLDSTVWCVKYQISARACIVGNRSRPHFYPGRG